MLWDSENVPKPESYVENNESPSGHGPGGPGAGGGPGNRGGAGGRGSGMLANLMKSDADSDGTLSATEIPEDFKPMLARIDTNKDGALDQAELKAMADSFAARRSDSRDTARDPIVYGAAAVDGTIVIRTGTRLYCIQ